MTKGKLLKDLRKKLNISQEKLAESMYISVRHLSRLENDQSQTNIWDFMSFMQVAGISQEDYWVLAMQTDDYEDYMLYSEAKKLLRNRNFEAVTNLITKIKSKPMVKQKFIQQFIIFIEVVSDENLDPDTSIKILLDGIKISKKDFSIDRIQDYYLNYNEINILKEMANCYEKKMDYVSAIEIYTSLMDNRKKLGILHQDKGYMLSSIMYNLSNLFGRSGKYREALKVCNEALEICEDYKVFEVVPRLLYGIANAYYYLKEDEVIYKPYIIRAYHTAMAHRDFFVANFIKNDAKEDFGIVINYD